MEDAAFGLYVLLGLDKPMVYIKDAGLIRPVFEMNLSYQAHNADLNIKTARSEKFFRLSSVGAEVFVVNIFKKGFALG